MKKSTIITSIVCLTSIVILCTSAAIKSNGSIVDYTQSPIDGAGDCSGCHRPPASTVPVVHFSSVPAFGAGNTYMPNTTYTISLNLTGYPAFGFDLEIVNSQSATSTADGGTFVSAVSNCKFTASTGPTSPTNVTHTFTIPTNSSASFKWKSPASGPVYLYSSVLGVNQDGGQSGDRCVAYNLTLNASPLGVKEAETSNVNLNVFPNPASSDLHLRYTLEKQSQVSIKIYDLTGKMAAELLNETLPAGEQTFDSYVPSNLSKGIYTLNLTVDGTPVIKKLVIR
jgi:hypothetical protein